MSRSLDSRSVSLLIHLNSEWKCGSEFLLSLTTLIRRQWWLLTWVGDCLNASLDTETRKPSFLVSVREASVEHRMFNCKNNKKRIFCSASSVPKTPTLATLFLRVRWRAETNCQRAIGPASRPSVLFTSLHNPISLLLGFGITLPWKNR